jgi:hypothetical protein
MFMKQDLVHRLREIQRHLVEISRATDAASVHLRTILAELNTDDSRKPDNDQGGDS